MASGAVCTVLRLVFVGEVWNPHLMNPTSLTRRTLTFVLLLALSFSLVGPMSLVPSVEAASASASKRIIKKLKKQITGLKKQLASLNQQLADALQPAPFIEMVTVGNAGNGADSTTYGAVPYEFQIGKYEVTNAQYVAFLNAVAATDTYGLYNTNMGSNIRGGITQIGTSGIFTYAARLAMADKPVNYVSWFDAARFCNWMHNGRPTGAQDAGTTETGVYALNGATSGVGFTKEAGAKFWIPSEDEWYKAAYHQPASASVDTDDYWLYPTGSNEVPTVATVNGIGEITNDDGNLANYDSGADWNTQNGNVTTVGSGGSGSASYYGAFDMCGNVGEWNETVIDGSFRGLRGGSWDDFEFDLRSSGRSFGSPGIENSILGFRVASP
jgi:formylglycine-generating enzyme